MKVKTQEYNDVVVVELQGEFDHEFGEMFRNTISTVVSKHKMGVVLDMNGVNFIDSCGLSELLWARDYCSENMCQLKLAGLDESCAKILEITRLDRAFEVYGELAQAVKGFA
jgi:anti-sigma B factor antagonist